MGLISEKKKIKKVEEGSGKGAKNKRRRVQDPDEEGLETVPRPGALTLAAWNVNGLRSVLKKGALLQYLRNYDPDVLGLGELKIPARKLKNVKALRTQLADMGYQHQFWHACEDETKGYSGVGIISKIKPEKVVKGWQDPSWIDEEGRVITAFFDDFIFLHTYVPCSGMNSQFEEKRREFDSRIFGYYEEIRKAEETGRQRPIMWAGDLNVAPEVDDVFDSRTNPRRAEWPGHMPWE